MGIFKIKADRFEWIGGVADDPQDLCLHGRVTVQFGDTVVEDMSRATWFTDCATTWFTHLLLDRPLRDRIF